MLTSVSLPTPILFCLCVCVFVCVCVCVCVGVRVVFELAGCVPAPLSLELDGRRMFGTDSADIHFAHLCTLRWGTGREREREREREGVCVLVLAPH